MKPNIVSERMIAWAQIVISMVLLLAFIGVLFAQMYLPVPANQPASTTANVNQMVGLLGTLATLAAQFFLARQRNASSPADPNPPTTGDPGNGKTSNPPGPGVLSGTNSGAPI